MSRTAGSRLPSVPCSHARDPQRTSTHSPADESRRLAAALPQEHYYSSYGEPEPLTLPQPEAPSDHTPWLPIGLSLATALAIFALSATQLRRLRHRRRTVRATT